MSSRPKRARSSTTNEDVNVDAQANTDGNSKPRPHDVLWFEDGNIVLASDVHLYCVHRGVLAKNSSVFRDMLELPNVAGTSVGVNGESWEGEVAGQDGGVTATRMCLISSWLYTTSSAHELSWTREHFSYEVLRDNRFYSAYKPTTLPIIISLLLMSTKVRHPCHAQQSHKSSSTRLPQQPRLYAWGGT